MFNGSFQFQGVEQGLAGSTLGPSLLAVFLHFRERAVDPEDQPLLRFICRDLKPEEQPTVYEWRVLLFGTTCSPCCATYALHKHILDHIQPGHAVSLEVLLRRQLSTECSF